MLNFGNKEFRNLQEQVFKNMKDIQDLLEGTNVLNEFGIKVIGQVATVMEMPTVADYKENNPNWEYGDAYAVGTEAPYTLYILTRENETHLEDFWFDIGNFPAPGPQGPQGPQGEQGVQGQTGPSGQDGLSAGFGEVSATAETLPAGSDATVSVTASGPNTEKSFSFTFGIPEGEPGQDGASEWGSITGNLSDQTDLVNALQAKQNTLVSGTNIKTINNTSILGSGNIDIQSAVWGNITGTLSSQTDLKTALDAKQDTISDLATIRSGAAAGATAVQLSDLATVATSGSYTDLTDKPTIPSVSGTNDGTNWTSITIDNDTYAIPQGGGTGTVTDVQVNGSSVVNAGVANINNMVTTDTAQTISGAKTLTSNLTMSNSEIFLDDYMAIGLGKSGNIGNYIKGQGNNNGNQIIDILLGINSAKDACFTFINNPSGSPAFYSWMANPADLGTDYCKWRNLYLSNALTDGTNSISVAAIVGKQNAIDDLDNIRWGAYLGSTAVQPAAISDMATQTWVGQQGYLTSVSWSEVSNKPTFATVATTGDYDDLINKPTIPAAQVNSDWNAVSGVAQILNKPTLATVATTGDYDDLTDKPDLSIYAQSANLATVATSGSYNDLSNKPTIPTATSELTNDSGFITSAAIPTNVSAFTNDAGYITSSAIPTNYVTTDTAQTITGQKTVSTLKFRDTNDYGGNISVVSTLNKNNLMIQTKAGYAFIDLTEDTSSGNVSKIRCSGSITSVSNNSFDLGATSKNWRNLYLAGNITDGTNTITVANIASKTDVSTAIAGQTKETWTFTLSDGTTTTKTIVLG